MVTILIVLAVLMLVGAIPVWPHSRTWGYRPSGGLGLVLVDRLDSRPDRSPLAAGEDYLGVNGRGHRLVRPDMPF